MTKRIKRAFVVALGILFVILGIFGLALPFLQGFLFLFIGVILLSVASPRIRVWMERHTRRYPRLHKIVERTDAHVRRLIGEV